MAILVPTFDLEKTIGEHVEINADTVGALLDEAESRYGEPFSKAVAAAAIVVNGRSINFTGGRRTRLKPEDRVWMVKPSAGG